MENYDQNLEKIKNMIINDPINEAYTSKNIMPLYSVNKNSKILIVGQAPGIKAQNSKITWNDKSGDTLRQWLGVSKDEFYNTNLFGLIPMDFYYPGKGKSGDLPPRKEFFHYHDLILPNLVKVKLIILVGFYAQKYYLKDLVQNNLTNTVKMFDSYLPKYIVIPHPSPLNFRWLNKNPWFSNDIVPKISLIVRSILNNKKN
jgi:uracil-DNA glycosylase